MTEKRKNPRVEVTWMAMCEIPSGQECESYATCDISSPIITDLCIDGMRLVVWSDLPKNLVLKIVMSALNISEYIEVLAKVRWCRESDSEKFDVGVQIIEFVHGSKEKLSEIIK
jgi:hypothetical protein